MLAVRNAQGTGCYEAFQVFLSRYPDYGVELRTEFWVQASWIFKLQTCPQLSFVSVLKSC